MQIFCHLFQENKDCSTLWKEFIINSCLVEKNCRPEQLISPTDCRTSIHYDKLTRATEISFIYFFNVG